jgi:metal-dependent amidase/aminoacylase/carboxypeptidase family protein
VAENVFHVFAALVCMVHCWTSGRLETLLGQVDGCFRAGGQAAGARVEVEVTRGYKDHVPNVVLARSYERCWRAMGDMPDPQMPSECAVERQVTYVPSSTDQGDLSHVMPSLNASFAIPPGPEGGGPHTRDFEKASGTREAFERALRVGKALAGVAVDVLATEGLLEEVKREWKRDMEVRETGSNK